MARDLDERPLQLQLGWQTRASLCARVELGQSNGGLSELLRGEVGRLLGRLLGDERMNLQTAGDLAGANALVRQTRDLADTTDVSYQRRDEPDQLA